MTPIVLGSIIIIVFALGFVMLWIYRFYAELKVREWQGEPIGYINFLLISPDRAFVLEGPTFKLALEEGALKEYLIEKILNEIEKIPSEERVKVLKALKLSLDGGALPLQFFGLGRGKDKAFIINYSNKDLLSYAKINPEFKIEYPYQLRQVYIVAYCKGREWIKIGSSGIKGKFKLLGFGGEDAIPAYFIYPIDFNTLTVYDISEEPKQAILTLADLAKNFVDYHKLKHEVEMLESQLKAAEKMREEAKERYTSQLTMLEDAVTVAEEAVKTGGILNRPAWIMRLLAFILIPTFIFWFIGSLIQQTVQPNIRTDLFMLLGLTVGIALTIFKLGK